MELQEEWDIPLFHVDGGIYGNYEKSGYASAQSD